MNQEFQTFSPVGQIPPPIAVGAVDAAGDSRPNSATGAVAVRPSYSQKSGISSLYVPGLVLAELVFDPLAQPGKALRFAVRQNAQITYADQVQSYKPLGWLEPSARNGALRLPLTVRPYGTVDDLAARMDDFIGKYFDCSTMFRRVAVLYALHTWIYDKFHAVPYLRFLGMPGTGKTRAMEVIGSLCHHPLVITGASSAAVVYRQIDAVAGTMLMDEADFHDSGVGSDIAKILTCGYQRGLTIMRCEKVGDEWLPRAYDPFGPKIICGRRRFEDDAVEDRCLTYTPSRSGRNDIPLQLPASFEDEVREIQACALAWRMESLDTFVRGDLSLEGFNGRAGQINAAACSRRKSDERSIPADVHERPCRICNCC